MGIFNWFKSADKESKGSTKTYYDPLPKYYAFNETGNVMVCTTTQGQEVVSDTLKTMFSDMSIFFAAMTKAIATHKDAEGKSGSIYSSDAILKILGKSELFVEAKQESITVSSSAVGDTMSKELTEHVLGRGLGESNLHFSRGLFRSMSEHAEHGDAGSIFFICENILGLPMVSAVVVKLDSPDGEGVENGQSIGGRKMSEILDIEEHEGTNSIVRKWIFEKRTYIFISPRSISAANFPDPGDDVEYENLVASMREPLEEALEKQEE